MKSRDSLSPSHVMSNKGIARQTEALLMQVADFGLSRQAESQTVDTDTYGTVTHMPPELLMEGKLTKSADVYAFGVLLWEMYTGEHDA